ncbi:MAG: protein of unknown function with transrane region [Candidatus Paceibacter sp.]|jgi:hypothetical protein|nr:protein of unknown function with transrane region [Candidatus Paceibacter sp.]
MEQTQALEHMHTPHTEAYLEPGATWEAPEYHHTHKTTDWYWGLAIITITVVIISILLGDVLFALFLLLASFTMSIFAHRLPRTVKIEMNTRGIKLDRIMYFYKDIESFWIELDENIYHPKIILKSKRLFMPLIAVPLGDMNPDDVGDFLAQFLKEEEIKEPILQRLLEDVGF